jgi:integrase
VLDGGHEYEYLFTLALLTGTRPSEYRALRWHEDVDFERRAIHVRQGVWQKRRHEFIFGPAKSDGSERSIAVTELELTALRAQRERQDVQRRQAGSAWAGLGLVFTEADGTPLDQDRMRRALADGENPKVVQERLGHSSVSLTLDTYSSVLPGIHGGAAERLAARFAKGSPVRHTELTDSANATGLAPSPRLDRSKGRSG